MVSPTPTLYVLLTSAVFTLSSSAAAFLNFKARKPRNTLTPPLIPLEPILMVALLVAFASFVVLLALVGPNR